MLIGPWLSAASGTPSVTDRDSMRTVDTRMCVTTKGTRGSGDPGVVGRGANRNQGTLELGSLRGPAS